MSEQALKKNKSAYGLVRKIDANTRAVAKLASAIDYIAEDHGAIAELNRALFDVIQVRRNLRAQLEDTLKGAR